MPRQPIRPIRLLPNNFSRIHKKAGIKSLAFLYCGVGVILFDGMIGICAFSHEMGLDRRVSADSYREYKMVE